MSGTWQVQEAKARFSEFLEAAMTEGPQIVTKRGVEATVLVPIDQWRTVVKANQRNIKDWLLAAEARTDNLVPPRQRRRRRNPSVLD